MRAKQNPFQNLNPETGGDNDGEEEISQPQRRQRVHETEDRAGDRVEDIRRWEYGMRTTVPEFHGSIQPEEFLEWMGIVEEILEFKRVPGREKVALMATRLRGRAEAWCGLRTQILDMINLFDPVTVTEAHQRALQLEKTLSRKSTSGQFVNFGRVPSSRNRASSTSENTENSTISGQQNPTNTAQTPRATTSGFRCFGYGETGHRLSECPWPAKKVLFNDPTEFNEEDVEIGEEPQLGKVAIEELVDGDTGTMLMINPNAYRLKLPTHIHTHDVFNIKHLIPFRGDSSDDEAVGKSRSNFLQPGENDAAAIDDMALEFMEG
ncbi:hypothetical protein JRO89_XS15G0008000 [Xanthoceras sorbifolium]|uniref:Reverse transcriptase domain-containing protein n=1 Tax=Xanthoceras sorbifolium TaxID=99658 RepID=A0ABQ8H0K2_9ROSI|nr:hypothetical protein JRO89_XS15G0008000 [Xanthoceras sorbifolium]